MHAVSHVELMLLKRHETDAAILVTDGTFTSDGTKLIEVWLPKSQIRIEECNPYGTRLMVLVPVWLAQEKGLI